MVTLDLILTLVVILFTFEYFSLKLMAACRVHAPPIDAFQSVYVLVADQLDQ